MRALFAGTPEPAAEVFRRLLAHDCEWVGVLTKPDAPAGRGRRAKRCAVAQEADAAGIEVWQPQSLRNPAAEAWLSDKRPDVVIVVAYGLMIPVHLLHLPRHGWLNLHFSLLPAWRGAAPVQHAIEAGDEVTGVSVFQIEEGLDTGPIFGQATEAIRSDDTAGSLFERLCASGAELMAEVMTGLTQGTLAGLPQDHASATWAGRITTEHARLDWRSPALAISRKVRAMSPSPTAWTTIAEQRLKLTSAVDVCADRTCEPGQIRVDRSGVYVGTGSTDVRLGMVQPAGKASMMATDWVRGVRIEPMELR
ncbi:MAG: methionyl-tRNA formyltransferase [Actinobacteria bacterium]|nr:methionyl-tRNA formyltransferase [Actinomycetota bacterium]